MLKFEENNPVDGVVVDVSDVSGVFLEGLVSLSHASPKKEGVGGGSTTGTGTVVPGA
jgi:hypothetical protein